MSTLTEKLLVLVGTVSRFATWTAMKLLHLVKIHVQVGRQQHAKG
jgi:hypothetical protein